MTPRDLLPDDAVDFFYKWYTTIKNLEKPLTIMKEEGFPVREHYDRLMEHKQWAEKMARIFNLTI